MFSTECGIALYCVKCGTEGRGCEFYKRCSMLITALSLATVDVITRVVLGNFMK